MSDIPEWAKKRAVELANESRAERFGSWQVEHVEHDATLSAFARYIAEHEEPPVDPLLLEAREICAARGPSSIPAVQFTSGCRDEEWMMGIALTALERGIELAQKEQP